MYHVYVLKSADGLSYTGHTDNLFRRLCEHNTGRCKTTKAGTRWKLVYYEEYATRGEAMKREKWMKTGSGRDFIRKILGGGDSALRSSSPGS